VQSEKECREKKVAMGKDVVGGFVAINKYFRYLAVIARFIGSFMRKMVHRVGEFDSIFESPARKVASAVITLQRLTALAVGHHWSYNRSRRDSRIVIKKF